MRKVTVFIVLAAASFAVAAQQQNRRSAGPESQTRSGQTRQGADSKIDKTLVERAR